MSKDLWSFAPDDSRVTARNIPDIRQKKIATPEHLVFRPGTLRSGRELVCWVNRSSIVIHGLSTPQYFHRYMYCYNNPINLIDRQGYVPRPSWWENFLEGLDQFLPDAIGLQGSVMASLPFIGMGQMGWEYGLNPMLFFEGGEFALYGFAAENGIGTPYAGIGGGLVLGWGPPGVGKAGWAGQVSEVNISIGPLLINYFTDTYRGIVIGRGVGIPAFGVSLLTNNYVEIWPGE